MEKQIKKINKKKIVFIVLILLLIIATITIHTVYCMNESFRNWVDIKILQKEILQGSTPTIEINRENNSNIYAFDKYIVILENKALKIYNSSGEEKATITTDISNPIFDTAGKYLAVAEKDGESVYLLEEEKLLWSTKIEGKISEVEINENGYAGVIISDISYKNIINVYNTQGKNLLKTYVATNKVVDVSISKNNQYLAIAEIDMSGVLIQSSIKVIDIVKAQNDPSNSIINTHVAKVDKLITNIEYQNKERLVCMYNDSINIMEDNNDKQLTSLENHKITFSSVELKNNIVLVEEEKEEEYSSSSHVKITNISNNKTRKYNILEIAKEIHTYENVMALNLGTELHIINTNGWLMKKYIASQEINKVIISNKIVGIIYRDKIEIINL